MISVTIDESIKERCPEAVLGLLQCKVNVHPDDEEFLALLNGKIAELSEVELSPGKQTGLHPVHPQSIQSTGQRTQPLPQFLRSHVPQNCQRTGLTTSIMW